MNAPYDGDRGSAAANSGHPRVGPRRGPPPGHDQASQPPADPYVQDAYGQDPYRAQDIAAQDPVAEALYDRSAHPPPPPGPQQPQQPLYGQPPQSPYAPDPGCGPRRPLRSRTAPLSTCRTETTRAPRSTSAWTTSSARPGAAPRAGRLRAPLPRPAAERRLPRPARRPRPPPGRRLSRSAGWAALSSTPPLRCPDPRPPPLATTRAPLRPRGGTGSPGARARARAEEGRPRRRAC